MRYLVGFWNLENLFAPEGYPDREPWLAKTLAKDLSGWTEQLFLKKVAQLASIIAKLKGGMGPDLLGVCEVENAYVMQTLAAAVTKLLPARDYGVIHVDNKQDRRGIDTAFIYDKKTLTPLAGELFSYFVMRRTGTRDITQQTFKTTKGNELIALANHWPSRSGGHPVVSQGYRMTAGETLGYWHERIREMKGKQAAVLAMGDLNDDPGDASVVIHANASRERDDIEKALSARFYNLAWNYLRQQVTTKAGKPRTIYGSLYFDGNGNVFDQILVSGPMLNGDNKLSVVESTARIEAYADMVSTSKNEGPIRFGLPAGDAAKNVNQAGYSDHFPVSVEIEEAD
jgi:hypothetical protein